MTIVKDLKVRLNFCCCLSNHFVWVYRHVGHILPLTVHRVVAVWRFPRERVQVVVRARKQAPAPGLERDHAHCVGRARRLAHALHLLEVPEAHRAIVAARGEQKLSWMKLETVDGRLMALQVGEKSARLEIPDLDHLVVAHRRDPLAIRAKAERVDGVHVAFIGEDAAFSAQVPQANLSVVGARRDVVGVVVILETRDVWFVTVEIAHQAAGVEIPHFDGARRGARDALVLARRERDAVDGRRVASETHDARGRFAECPQVDLFVVATGSRDATRLGPNGATCHVGAVSWKVV